MTQHSGKSSDFIEVKTNLQMYILRIILFIKTAVSSNDCLDPGPQAIAGLRHGVPVEGPHHLLYLLDQILGFVCSAKELQWGELGGQTSSFYTSLRFSLSHSCILLLSWAAVLEDVLVISRYPSASFDTILSNLFWNVHLLHPGGGGEGADLPRSLVMSLSRLAAMTVLFLPVKTATADPLEAINFWNFLSSS